MIRILEEAHHLTHVLRLWGNWTVKPKAKRQFESAELQRWSQKAERFQFSLKSMIKSRQKSSTVRLSGCDVDLMTNGSKHLQTLLSSVLQGEHSTTTLATARTSRVSCLLCCYVIGSYVSSMRFHILRSYVVQWTIWQLLSGREVLLGNPWKSFSLLWKHRSLVG